MNLTEAIIGLSKAFGVGTIRAWANGKKYQKQANGKWVEFVQPKAKTQKKEESSSTYKEDYKDVDLVVFEGTKRDAYKAMGLAGVPKGFNGKVQVSSSKLYAFVNIYNKDLEMERRIYYNENYVENYEFRIKDKGKYNGCDIFYNQVKNVKKEGFSKIVTKAGGIAKMEGNSMNGYYTWLRLGYEPDEGTNKRYAEKANKELGTSIKSITELMYSQEGRDWWRKNGESFDGTFDLSENSYSMKTLNNYINERQKSNS